jgi:hypothetical protein
VVDAFEDAEVARRVVPPSELPVVRFGIEKQAFLSRRPPLVGSGNGLQSVHLAVVSVMARLRSSA